MKNFRKTQEGLYVCEECNSTFKTKMSLNRHISSCHYHISIYCEKYLKEINEGKCKICGKPTEFSTRKSTGYYKLYCSNKCKVITIKNSSSQETVLKRRQTCLEKYGSETYNNPEKNKKTCIEKYGVCNILANIEFRKQKNLKKHGDENYNNSEKRKFTNLIKYGGTTPISSPIIKNKIRSTCKKRYGVYNPGVRGAYYSRAAINYIKKFINDNNIDETSCYYYSGGINGKEYYQTIYKKETKKYQYFSFDLVVVNENKLPILLLEYNGPWHYSKEEIIKDPDSCAYPWKENTTSKKQVYENDIFKLNFFKEKYNCTILIYNEKESRLQTYEEYYLFPEA